MIEFWESSITDLRVDTICGCIDLEIQEGIWVSIYKDELEDMLKLFKDKENKE